MDNTDKCVQFYELSANTTSRMIYVFAKDRTCPLPAIALPHSDSSAQTGEIPYIPQILTAPCTAVMNMDIGRFYVNLLW